MALEWNQTGYISSSVFFHALEYAVAVAVVVVVLIVKDMYMIMAMAWRKWKMEEL